MSKVEKRVRSLIREDSEMRDAVEVSLDNATDGEVQWIDVRDKITSGQWGRLIEKEVLVDGETGFALADRDGIEAGLEDDDSTGSDIETAAVSALRSYGSTNSNSWVVALRPSDQRIGPAGAEHLDGAHEQCDQRGYGEPHGVIA